MVDVKVITVGRFECVTTAERRQRRGRVDHGTGGHENYAASYKRYVWLCSRIVVV